MLGGTPHQLRSSLRKTRLATRLTLAMISKYNRSYRGGREDACLPSDVKCEQEGEVQAAAFREVVGLVD